MKERSSGSNADAASIVVPLLCKIGACELSFKLASKIIHIFFALIIETRLTKLSYLAVKEIHKQTSSYLPFSGSWIFLPKCKFTEANVGIHVTALPTNKNGTMKAWAEFSVCLLGCKFDFRQFLFRFNEQDLGFPIHHEQWKKQMPTTKLGKQHKHYE